MQARSRRFPLILKASAACGRILPRVLSITARGGQGKTNAYPPSRPPIRLFLPPRAITSCPITSSPLSPPIPVGFFSGALGVLGGPRAVSWSKGG